MRNLVLASMVVVLLVGCDMASPTGPSSTTIEIESEFFTIVQASDGFTLAKDHATAADQKLRKVAACMGVDPYLIKGHRILLYAVGEELPCPVLPDTSEGEKQVPGGCYGNKALKLYEAYTVWDQGWRHEMIHALLKAMDDPDWRKCPASDDPRLNEKPWVCQLG